MRLEDGLHEKPFSESYGSMKNELDFRHTLRGKGAMHHSVNWQGLYQADTRDTKEDDAVSIPPPKFYVFLTGITGENIANYILIESLSS